MNAHEKAFCLPIHLSSSPFEILSLLAKISEARGEHDPMQGIYTDVEPIDASISVSEHTNAHLDWLTMQLVIVSGLES